MTLPSYETICQRFGFRVPCAYHELLMLAFELSPSDPWNAFRDVDLCGLGSTYLSAEGNGFIGYTECPPDVKVFGWTGTDGGQLGFILDDVTADEMDPPVALIYPGCSSDTGVIAINFASFIGYLLAPSQCSDADADVQGLRVRMHARFPVCVPPHRQVAASVAQVARVSAGAVPTLDRVGVIVPESSVDRVFLDSLTWPTAGSWKPKAAPNERRLGEAFDRLYADEVGTALVIARNFRYLHWYDDWSTGRNYIRTTGDILECAYERLGRYFAARAVRQQTEYALANVI
jgi:hypothetical protein